MKVGYIGLGIMGRPMAANLLGAGHELWVYNRTGEKCRPLAEQGAQVCSCPAEVAERVEVVFINVTDTPDVEQVIFGADGLVDTAEPGLVIVDNSTISPHATREFAARLKKMEVDLLDAPVSGGDIGARDGTLAIMVGGDRGAFERCLPLLETLGQTITYMGPAGMGQTCKACNQLFGALHTLACCEGINLARQAGLDPARMIEVVSQGAGGSWALKHLGPKIVAGDWEPGFMIDLICKDLRLVLEMGQETHASLIGANLAEQMFTEAREAGLGRCGTQALIEIIKRMNFTPEDEDL